MTYFRKNIDEMAQYIPGRQPAAGEKVIKLNTNENPYPPSPAALEALRNYDGSQMRVYPDPMAGQFCKTAAEVLGVPAEWILPGTGSDDLIVMTVRACAGPDRPVVYPSPTFPYYLTQAQIAGAGVVDVPCDENFKLPAEKIISADGAITFVANPNTPTGVFTPIDELDELAGELSGVLVIDEAYVDFAEASALDLVTKHANVIVLRTLSKSYSLAGLRLGFAVGQPEMLEGLVKTKSIYNISGIACAIGTAAMADQAYMKECAVRVIASRDALTSDLQRLGFTVCPSQANFLLARPPAGDGERVYQELLEMGILVRYFRSGPLADKLRITVGTEAQNTALTEALVKLV